MKPTPVQLEALGIVAEGRFYPNLVREDDGWHARWRPLRQAENPQLCHWVDHVVRAAALTPLSADAEDQTHRTLHDAWMLALRSRTGLVRWDDAECAAFAAGLGEWADPVVNDRARDLVFRMGKDLVLSCNEPRGRRALRALGESVRVWGPLRGLRRRGEGVLAVALEPNEAEDLVRRGARELTEAGCTVELGELSASITAEADFTAASGTDPRRGDDAGSLTPSLVIKVDGHPVTAEEIRFLLEQKSTFVYFHEHWIEIDRSILKEALRALEKCGKAKVNPLAFALGIGAIGRLEIAEARVGGALGRLLAELRTIGGDGEFTPPDGLRAELRPYQARGVAWMKALTDRGFGALLADDMGLGKTLQTIAWLLSARSAAEHPALVIAPLTLLSNWAHEFAKFAPGLKVYVHQGEFRHLASGFRRAVVGADVVVTSYNLIVKDHSLFAGVGWDAVVLDEAQTVKNPSTQAARAIRALMPPRRVALTGTPIENSVADLWSIEEFLNPGFLGDRRDFEERFVKPLSADPMHSAGRRLRKALEPFVLRRLKGDPQIAAELGEKRVTREYCRLSDRQRAEYEQALADYRVSHRRQGDVFAFITALKLICDGDGKIDRLKELLAQIFEAGESVLVFTQYAKVGAALKKKLDQHFGTDMPFLHGALSVRERERQIETFNRKGGAFILSLKAGGFGLNLVRATHVVHFDRWWNPAVENQATDRAHRIGQEKDVFVHEFITAGTLEEHIDDILTRKSTLEGLLKDGEALWRAVQLGEEEP